MQNGRYWVLFMVFFPVFGFNYSTLEKIHVYFSILNSLVPGHNRRIHELLCRSQRLNRHRCLFYHHDEECLETLIVWLNEWDFISIFCRFPWLNVCKQHAHFPKQQLPVTVPITFNLQKQFPDVLLGWASEDGQHNQRVDLASSHCADLSLFYLHPWHIFSFLRWAAFFTCHSFSPSISARQRI